MSRFTLMLALCLVLGACRTSRPELEVSFYGGRAWNSDGDLILKRPDGTDLTLSDVVFGDESFEKPPYYGMRGTAWFGRRSPHGIALEFTHVKVVVDENDAVDVEGTSAGQAVSGERPISDFIDKFNLTHGHNFVTVNYMYRWLPKCCHAGTLRGRIRPYVGIGAGVAVPHVEVRIGDDVTSEYQLAGPAFQALAGVSIDLLGPASAFAEAKLHYADLDMDLEGGGSLEADPWTAQIALGLSLRF